MITKGYSVEIAGEDADKDFGDGLIGHFNCGHVYFRKADDTCMLYQSRFSDNWAIDRNGRRPTLVARLASIDQMNDEKFVDTLLVEMLEEAASLGADPSATPETKPIIALPWQP